jgi:hypothetical protein
VVTGLCPAAIKASMGNNRVCELNECYRVTCLVFAIDVEICIQWENIEAV